MNHVPNSHAPPCGPGRDSEKARIPAWCDRVLSKGAALRQTHYSSAPLRFSDHRPVHAGFVCTVDVLDDARRDALARALYARRRRAVNAERRGGSENTGETDGDDDDDDDEDDDDDDDDDLLGYESVEPGLPPASSDRRKWWLDNGASSSRAQSRSSSLSRVPSTGRCRCCRCCC